MFEYLILFFSNLIYSTLLFRSLESNNSEVVLNGLNNIKQDFERINFPLVININIVFVCLIISSIISLFTISIVYKKINTSNVLSVTNNMVTLFLLNLGTTLSTLYFFRVSDLSRGILLISFIVYPLIFIIYILLLKNIFNRNIFSKWYIKLVSLSIFAIIVAGIAFQNNLNNLSTTSVKTAEQVNENFSSGFNFVGENLCHEWSGSANFTKCITGATSEVISGYDTGLNNLVSYEDNLYVLKSDGLIFQLKANYEQVLFLDISEKLSSDDSGKKVNLFSFAFHPSSEYFLVSYADVFNSLIIEKYYLDLDGKPILDNSEVLLTVPNSSGHYSGNIIWSKYFEDFLISIGDMQSFTNSVISSEPLDTTSIRGKIIFLNKLISKPDLISHTDIYKPRKDLLAYGLRNPWKTIEYKNYLIVPDVGNVSQEELNVVNLDNYFKNENKPYLFGWPLFEGVLDSIESNINTNNPSVLFWDKGSPNYVKTYINENSIKPVVYYNHQAPTTFRAAIIGGDVNEDVESQYFEYYFFADYLSKEVFSFDLSNENLYSIPLPQDFDGYITSVLINPFKKDSLLVSTTSGLMIEIVLPVK